jgi:peptidoglycan/LPS O-acetylase OafA/YrhL
MTVKSRSSFNGLVEVAKAVLVIALCFLIIAVTYLQFTTTLPLLPWLWLAMLGLAFALLVLSVLSVYTRRPEADEEEFAIFIRLSETK